MKDAGRDAETPPEAAPDSGHDTVRAVMEPLDFHRLTPKQQRETAHAFCERICARRSVRRFSSEPVPFELIETAIQAANSAPSGANKQPWRFVVVRDPEIKRRIREAAEAEEKENYSRRFPPEWKQSLAPIGTDWHKEFLETAPYLIVVFSMEYEITKEGAKHKHYYVQESVGLAAGFLLAALHFSGLATLTHTPSPMGFLSRILNRPKNERPFLLIPVGYPAGDATVPKLRKKSLADVMVVK